MIVLIQNSQLFTRNPADRFAEEYGTTPDTWDEIWKRHKLMGYTPKELKEYFILKVGKRPNKNAIRKWILRTEIYSKTQPLIRSGVRAVRSEYFGDLEKHVIWEITKNMRFSGDKTSRNMA
jgi:hypothetical protein